MIDPAARVSLGRTELAVTRLGLGCAPLAGLFAPVSETAARDVVDQAWEQGLRLFDTAPLYGSGLSERRVGAALRLRPRSEIVLSTKVGRLLLPGGEPDSLFAGADHAAPEFDFSADGALRSLEASLGRLGLDRVDIALIHDPDDHFEEALAGSYVALERLRREGVVGAIGVGMNQAPMLARFAREADIDCLLLAGRYTLLDTSALAELLPLCEERGIAVIAGGVFNSGILSGGDEHGSFDYAPPKPEIARRVQRMTAICARFGVPLAAAAVQFPLAHPAVTCAVVGCRDAAELRADIAFLALELPAELWNELKAGGLLDVAAPVPAGR
jgi:aryl-alcohol dehydrogenase-like predicted oxidoreductase